MGGEKIKLVSQKMILYPFSIQNVEPRGLSLASYLLIQKPCLAILYAIGTKAVLFWKLQASQPSLLGLMELM